jgi:hypothetical protein
MTIPIQLDKNICKILIILVENYLMIGHWKLSTIKFQPNLVK